jgi:hypothetical protein
MQNRSNGVRGWLALIHPIFAERFGLLQNSDAVTGEEMKLLLSLTRAVLMMRRRRE